GHETRFLQTAQRRHGWRRTWTEHVNRPRLPFLLERYVRQDSKPLLKFHGDLIPRLPVPFEPPRVTIDNKTFPGLWRDTNRGAFFRPQSGQPQRCFFAKEDLRARTIGSVLGPARSTRYRARLGVLFSRRSSGRTRPGRQSLAA